MASVVQDPDGDAQARYASALARRQAIESEWRELGEPLMSTGSTGQLQEHPLVKMMREHDVLLDKLALPLRKRHDGPDPAGVVRAGIGKSPAAKIRRVK